MAAATALEADGTTLADVAEAQGVAVGTLVDALVTAAQERTAKAVEGGTLTQEQADERLADLEERITERINSDAPGPRHGPGSPGDRPADGPTKGDRARPDRANGVASPGGLVPLRSARRTPAAQRL